nr:hypothetical protein GASUdbv011_051 [Galdieria sulphuraria]
MNNNLYYYTLSKKYLISPWIYLCNSSVMTKSMMICVIFICFYLNFNIFLSLYIFIISTCILLSFILEFQTKLLIKKILFFYKIRSLYLLLVISISLNLFILKILSPANLELIYKTILENNFLYKFVIFFIINFYLINFLLLSSSNYQIHNSILSPITNFIILLTNLSEKEIKYSSFISERFLNIFYENFRYSSYIVKLKKFNICEEANKSIYSSNSYLRLIYKLTIINFKKSISSVIRISFNFKSTIYLS